MKCDSHQTKEDFCPDGARVHFHSGERNIQQSLALVESCINPGLGSQPSEFSHLVPLRWRCTHSDTKGVYEVRMVTI